MNRVLQLLDGLVDRFVRWADDRLARRAAAVARISPKK